MSVGRQELLIQELEVELLALSEGERQLTNDYLTNGYKSEIARGSLLDQTVLNKEMLEKYMTTVVNANFEGAKWSERIWKRQEQLRKLVKTKVTRHSFEGRTAQPSLVGSANIWMYPALTLNDWQSRNILEFRH